MDGRQRQRQRAPTKTKNMSLNIVWGGPPGLSSQEASACYGTSGCPRYFCVTAISCHSTFLLLCGMSLSRLCQRQKLQTHQQHAPCLTGSQKRQFDLSVCTCTSPRVNMALRVSSVLLVDAVHTREEQAGDVSPRPTTRPNGVECGRVPDFPSELLPKRAVLTSAGRIRPVAASINPPREPATLAT